MLGKTDGLAGLTMGELLRNQAINYPKYMAIVDVDNNKRYTYEEFNKRVNRLANALLDMGVKRSDIVAYFLKDRAEAIEVMFAVNKIGAIWVPVNYRFTAMEIERQMAHSEPKVFFFEEEHIKSIEDIKKNLPSIEQYVMYGEKKQDDYTLYYELLEASSEEEPLLPEMLSSKDIVGIIYTSGTTGVPKGAMHSHRTFLGWAFTAVHISETVRGDRLLNPYPVFHMGGTVASIAAIWAGATDYLFGKFDPWKYIKIIENEKITVAWAIPTIVHHVNSLPKEVKDKHKWSSLTRFVTSGGPFMTETQKDFTDQWPHLKVHSTYSATEAYFSNLRPEDQERKVRCVGPGVFGHELKVMDRDGNELPNGEMGLIYVQGISVFKGYYKNPEAEEKSFIGDWFTCEDMGYLDEEEYLYLVDRAKDVIVTGGENVASVEVENVLLEHPAIFECAVIGIPDEEWGEKIHAVVSLNPEMNVSPEEIINWSKNKIARYKCPRSIEIIQELPKSPVGKILKQKLREEYRK